MPRTFCLVKTCYNFQPSTASPAFFNLPSDVSSRNKWIENSGRLDLRDKTVSNLLGKYLICADHFEPHCFVNPLKRSALRRDADVFPTIFRSNLTSQMNIDSGKFFRDSQSTLAGTVLAEVESAQEILNAAVVSEDAMENAEWTNIVAVSLGNDGSLMCDTLNAPSESLPENTVSFISEDAPDSDEIVMECLMLCRLCAALVQISMLVPVFGEDADSGLQNMMDRIIPGQVLINDGLPQRVCTICVERLKNCCDIVDAFKTADSRLRQMVELCNFNDVVQNESLTIQDESGLPIILQTVNEDSAESLDVIRNTLNSNFTQADSTLHACVTSNIEQMKQADPVSNLQSAECIAIEDTINFSVQVEGDTLNFEGTHQMKCGVCEQVFEEQSDLVSHCINFHSVKLDETVFAPEEVNGAFQCTICDDVLPSDNCLRNHMSSHIIGTYECALCKLSFKDKSDLSKHFSIEHNSCLVQKASTGISNSNKCPLCGKAFKTAAALRKHKVTHSAERTVLCSLCGKTLANLNSLRVHMRIHSDARPFTCVECGKSFKGPSELRSHSLIHTREKKHECPECGRKFHSKGLVRQHMLSHTHEKPHKCDICTASFNRLGNLNQHKKKHQDKNTSPTVAAYECNACGKRFQSKLTLKYHLAKHTGDKYPFDCEICGKKFIAIDPYRIHMRVHTGERPYECQICKKTFRSAGTLKQHTSSLHVDDFPYACPYCQRSFKRLQSLIVHKKTHTGEKPWLCSQCGRAFSQKGDMIKHTKTHRHHIEEEEIIMEVDTIDDLALDNEISKMIFG